MVAPSDSEQNRKKKYGTMSGDDQNDFGKKIKMTKIQNPEEDLLSFDVSDECY
jgi:hypothetical protein